MVRSTSFLTTYEEETIQHFTKLKVLTLLRWRLTIPVLILSFFKGFYWNKNKAYDWNSRPGNPMAQNNQEF